MPTFDVAHCEHPAGRPDGLNSHIPLYCHVVARIEAASPQAAMKTAARVWPAPPGRSTSVFELPLSRVLRRWKDAGDEGFEACLEQYDALITSAEETLATDLQIARLSLLALADLAEERGLLPDLCRSTRSTASQE